MHRAVLGVVLTAGVTTAGPTHAGRLQSWAYLTEALVRDGVPRARVDRVFADARMPRFRGVEYSLAPKESRAMYRSFLRSKSVAAARSCRRRYRSAFNAAGAAHDVDPNVIAAILFVETRCGEYTGKHRVLYRLARLAMANEPANVNRNIDRHLKDPDGRTSEEVVSLARTRGTYLFDTFYPEVRAVFTIAERLSIDPLEIRGSGSGAFGLPQFLPSSYLKYGLDGDRNGRVSLYSPVDAIASCANYLKQHGWRSGLEEAARRKVIWHYNHSDPYVDTVLELAKRLR